MNEKNLKKVMAILDEFRKVDPMIAAPRMMTFLYIVKHEGISVRELQAQVDISYGSMDHNLKELEKDGLIEGYSETDPYARRAFRVGKRGKLMVSSLEALAEK